MDEKKSFLSFFDKQSRKRALNTIIILILLLYLLETIIEHKIQMIKVQKTNFINKYQCKMRKKISNIFMISF